MRDRLAVQDDPRDRKGHHSGGDREEVGGPIPPVPAPQANLVAVLQRDRHLRALLAEPRRTIPYNFIADGDHVAVEARGVMMTKAGGPLRQRVLPGVPA